MSILSATKQNYKKNLIVSGTFMLLGMKPEKSDNL